jgi:hypothetical protein
MMMSVIRTLLIAAVASVIMVSVPVGAGPALVGFAATIGTAARFVCAHCTATVTGERFCSGLFLNRVTQSECTTPLCRFETVPRREAGLPGDPSGGPGRAGPATSWLAGGAQRGPCRTSNISRQLTSGQKSQRIDQYHVETSLQSTHTCGLVV